MKIAMRSKKIQLTAEVKEAIERRIYFSIGRFTDCIRDVKVILQDMNGPRGGIDKSCQVTVHLKPYGELYIQDQSEDLQAVLYTIFERLKRVMERKIKKELRQKPVSDFGGNVRSYL